MDDMTWPFSGTVISWFVTASDIKMTLMPFLCIIMVSGLVLAGPDKSIKIDKMSKISKTSH